MERQTPNDLLDWLRAGPRSLGWNAIVAYDRSQANAALIQEYISRFTADSYLRPITATVDMSQEEAEYIYGFTLDRPRLSFENAKVAWSLARLSVKVVGGTQLTTRTPMGGLPQVIKVSSYDALNGPDITMGLTLNVLLGSVDVQGRVAIDLSKGTEIDVNFADSRDHRRIGGEFFRTYFESLPDEHKVFVLGEVGSSEGQALKPRNVQIRTQASPGSNVPGAADFGLGAILMFITLEGEEFGTFPANDEGLPYLIPHAKALGYSSTILLGNEVFVRKLVEEGCRRMTQTPELFEYETLRNHQGMVSGLRVILGQRTGTRLSSSLPSFPSLRVSGLQTPMAEQGAGKVSFELTFEADALVMDWRGEKNQLIELTTLQGVHHALELPSSWMWHKRYVFTVDAGSGKLHWVAMPGDDQLYCKLAPGSHADIPEVIDHFAEICDYVETALAVQLNGSVAEFVSPLEDLDVFRLNSILFRDRHVFEPISAHLPGDLVMFGRVAPDSTAFTLTPSEPLLGPAQTLQFKISPDPGGVSWRVEKLAGSSASPGVINPANGLYTAPPLAEIKGFFTRVRVIATLGEYSSSALVTVTVRDITFNPMVAVCGVGLSCELSAGARDGSRLEWSLGGQVRGSQILPSSEVHGDHTYFAPPAEPQPMRTFSLDEVQVKRPEDSASYSSFILVVHKAATAQVALKVDADLPDGSVQLYADLGLGPVEKGCTWTLMAGSGQVDTTTGVYTADPAGQHKFALVTVVVAPPGPQFPAYEGFIIIPLPLTLAVANQFSRGFSS